MCLTQLQDGLWSDHIGFGIDKGKGKADLQQRRITKKGKGFLQLIPKVIGWSFSPVHNRLLF